MAIVRITSPREITWEIYNQVAERVDAGGPVDGLIVHTAVDNNGKPRFIEVWESNEHAERFEAAQLELLGVPRVGLEDDLELGVGLQPVRVLAVAGVVGANAGFDVADVPGLGS